MARTRAPGTGRCGACTLYNSRGLILLDADRYDAFLFDLDGVLYRGDEPIPSAAEALIAAIRAAGKAGGLRDEQRQRHPRCRGRAVGARRGSRLGRRRGRDLRPDDGRPVGSPRDPGTFVAWARTGLLDALADAGIQVRLPRTSCRGPHRRRGDVEAVVVGLDRTADYDSLASCVLAGRCRRRPHRHESRHLLPRARGPSLAGSRRPGRGDRGHHRGRRRGGGQAERADLRSGPRPCRGRATVGGRRPARHRHRRGRPAGLGLAPGPHRDLDAGTRPSERHIHPPTSARTSRCLFEPGFA